MKNKLSIIILIALATLAIYLLATNQKGTYKELRDFAVEDTASVNKVFLADKAGNTILIERTSNYWVLNSNYIARPDLVNLLLKTVHGLKIQAPVAKAARDNIIKNMAVKSTKVEVYQKNKLTKVFYVGGPTPDSHGTYMILEKSSTPFIIDIPGFRGYLSTRFVTSETDWRWQLVFNYKPSQISQIELQNIKQPEQSFNINANTFTVTKPGSNASLTNIDTLALRAYLNNFKSVFFNKFIDDVPVAWQDSIINSQPMYILKVVDNNGKTDIVKAYNKPGWGKRDEFGEVLQNDPDNFFLLLNNGELVYAQYLSFLPLFKHANSFVKN